MRRTWGICFIAIILLGSFGWAQSRIQPSTPQRLATTETIVVTGTFTPLSLEELDRAVSVIDADQNSSLYDHWTSYLQEDSSIDLRRRAPNGVQSDISLRGSSFGQTLVMLDGFRMDDAQSGHHDMDLPLPTGSLERIEVLRGAGSTLYGSDALGGAANFLTQPAVHSEIRLFAGIGNFGTNQQSASASLVSSRWQEGLSIARDFSTGFMTDRDYRSLTTLSDTRTRNRLGATSVILAYADKPYGANQFYGNFKSWERTKSWFAGIRQELGHNTEFALGYRRHTDVFILIRDHPEIYENNHVTASWEVALRRKQSFGQNTTVFYGAEGNHDGIESSNLGNHERSRAAAYADVDFRVIKRFSLSVGGREEFFVGNGAQFSPSVGAGFWVRQGLRLRASASHGYRLPTYTDLFYHDPANAGNPSLKAESAWSYEAGVQWRSHRHLEADADIFQNRERNVIDYVQFFPGDINHAANIQRLNFTGVETSLKMHPFEKHSFTVSYTWIHGVQAALSEFTSTRYVFNYPLNNAVASWTGSLPCAILMRTRIGATQRVDRDPYPVWDIDLARSFGKLGVRGSFSNVTNTRYQEIAGVDMPGRSVLLGLEYTIRRNP